MKSHYFYHKLFFVLFFLFYVCFAYLLVGFDWSSLRVLSIISMIFFIFMCFCATLKEKYFWIAFPLVVLVMPNAINDFFPSEYMGDSIYVNMPRFALFTHIDLFFILGLLRYVKFGCKSVVFSKVGSEITFFSLLLIVSFILVILNSDFLSVSLFGSFQFRYILYAMVLVFFSNINIYQDSLLKGILLSLMLIVLEASVFTFIYTDGSRLTSGNYGVNTLAHLLAAILFYIYFSNFKYKFLIAVFVLFIIYLTGTRVTFLSIFFVYLVLYFLRSKSASNISLLIIFSPMLIFLFFVMQSNAREVLSSILFVINANVDIFNIARVDFASSFITRVQLWHASIMMLYDNFWFGVGPGVWSYVKVNYQIPFYSVLDPHHDLLNILVSYGVIGSIPFIYFYFYLPLSTLFKFNVTKEKLLFSMSILGFLLIVMFSGFANAPLWKHPIAMMYSLMVFLLVRNLKEV